MNSLLRLDNISMTFRGREVLQDVSFSVGAGEIVTLIGPNGAGKSTVMKIALGLLKPDVGNIERAQNLKIGYMPQKIIIDDTLPLSVKEFIKLAREYSPKNLDEVVALTRIEYLLDLPIQNISGGELQRVLLARAMMGKPDLLVLDEPVQGVDVTGQEEIYKMIADARHENGCGVLMISHDLYMVMAATDRVICLNHHICCSGSPENIQQNPAYLSLMGQSVDNIALYTHHHDHHHDSSGNVIEGEHGPDCTHG